MEQNQEFDLGEGFDLLYIFSVNAIYDTARNGDNPGLSAGDIAEQLESILDSTGAPPADASVQDDSSFTTIEAVATVLQLGVRKSWLVRRPTPGEEDKYALSEAGMEDAKEHDYKFIEKQ